MKKTTILFMVLCVCFSKAVMSQAPVNDNAAGAIEIITDAGCTGAQYSNVSATQSAGEPFGSCSATKGFATVWYKFTTPSGGAVRISTAAGSGNTLTNTRVALFSAYDVNDYSTFSIIGCDEDGGSGSFGSMSVLYATGLTVDDIYYIQVDKFDSAAAAGTFCLTVEKLRDTMLSANNNCNSLYQTPAGSVASYKGWVSLMDQNTKLIALVKNPAGGRADAYTAMQNVIAGPVRKDITSGEYYLNRSYTINNTASPGVPLQVQFFFRASELTALNALDPAASLRNLRLTSQSAASCQPDVIPANGTNTEISQTGNGTSSGVHWITATIYGYSNFYIHAVKSYLAAKVFLQGAYSSADGRHKDVTPAWASILNTYATKQPYNYSASADTAHEGFGAGNPGGTGKPIVHVTNLNASGPGSLVGVLGSNRTVVFDVGGTINDFFWEGNGVINLTIDGSTAPLPGITLNNKINGNGMSFDLQSHDIIVKNLRMRNSGNDGMNVINSYNILFDHISISGSGDGDLDITLGSYNITVQWSILGAGKHYWSGTMLIAYPGTKNISLHHNLFTTFGSGPGERNPFASNHNTANDSPNVISYLMADFTNNVVWKWGKSDGTYGFGSGADFGGTLQARNNFYQSPYYPDKAIVVNPNSTGSQVYASGNISGNSGVNPDNTSNVTTPWTVSPITTQDVCTAASLVVDRAGPRPLDETDQAFVSSVSLANCQGCKNQPPVANAGINLTLALPVNSTTLTGSGTDDGTIVSYAWTYVSGPAGYTLGTANAPVTALSNLVQGTYVFRLTVKDNDGATSTDDIRVIVVNNGTNQTPVANAGNTITLVLPGNSTSLTGTGTDADGTISGYAWARVSGPTTWTLTNGNMATATLSNLVAGTYIFKLTVTDNNGITGTDNVKIIVNPAIAGNTASYGGYAGTETVANGFFTSTAATTDIVDWVMLELKNYSGSIVSRRAALVREDGKIVDTDGISPVSLDGLVSGNYYVTVRHRNHLSISTQNLISFTAPALGVAPAGSSGFDFTAAADAEIFGDASAFKIINGTNVMTAGNANGNGNVRFTGLNNDAGTLLAALNGLQGATLNLVYHAADINMDGIVRYTGLGNDPGFLLSVLNANQALVFAEQRR